LAGPQTTPPPSGPPAQGGGHHQEPDQRPSGQNLVAISRPGGGARGPEAPGNDADLTAAPDSGGRGTAVATLPARPNPQAAPPVANPDTAPGVAGLMGTLATSLLIHVDRPGDGVVTEAGPVVGRYQPSAPVGAAVLPAAVPGEEPAEGRSVVPPVVPAVLAALPSVELAALETGLRQFLAQLEAAGRDLTGDDGDGLGPWLVAAGAAAAACEIARRQLRRQADATPPAGYPPIRLARE